MKTLFKYLLISSLVFSVCYVKAQKRHHPHKHHAHRKAVVVKRSPYRPTKVVIYHPHWRPAYAYHRRWVYWPKYNLYWDNWRNHYRFWNGTIWISQPAPPAVVVNVNLDKEKHSELKEAEDDTDEIETSNTEHKKDYKAE
ncbi:MAG: hypothetical protein IPM51_12875 [Sphingobacteriaceae bacterium]|nr:hypothetical protein [Sphingobacteriaceae bacterium]